VKKHADRRDRRGRRAKPGEFPASSPSSAVGRCISSQALKACATALRKARLISSSS